MIYNPFSLAGKTILITGASSGIGKATAIECSKMGASIIASGRDKNRLNETLSELEGEGHTAVSFDLVSNDLSDFLNTIPNLNGVVHCAGVSQVKPIKFMDPQSMEEIMKINFIGPVNLNNALIKNKKISKGASIVFISSISGNCATQIGEAGYGASKSAVLGYMRSAALEVASKGIRINCILPGIIETPLLNLSFEKFSKEEINQIKRKYPLHRFGSPQEVGLCAVYLLSDASAFVTGSSLVIDGGFSLS